MIIFTKISDCCPADPAKLGEQVRRNQTFKQVIPREALPFMKIFKIDVYL